ncbi:hypothetical protein GCM10007938_02950 [Vibrio zhanjiangensis]|uniref:Uncharacterized protein n=1 Tax=Vibrio zhanjiangensis TaxID=1046128 RepID=A0ABQ6EUM6_9VIBR|nr:hypothetical protein [Vibrio zhanjiangensis]GLT16519.1 hypothetical protein GCM10007938_02950 [Vibrio zhanjiangensis]
MNTMLTPKQPQNDLYLSDLEYNRVLLEKIKQKITELDSSAEAMLVVDLKNYGSHQKKILDTKQNEYDEFVEQWQSQSCLDEFDQECVTENQSKLDSRKKQYADLYQASTLTQDDDGAWYLDVDKDELNNIGLFHPTQIQQVYSEQGRSPIDAKTTCVTSERTVSLADSAFIYDDGDSHQIDMKDSVISNRFVWYWDTSGAGSVLSSGVAATNIWGKPFPLSMEPRFFDESGDQFTLLQPNGFQGLPALLHTKVTPLRESARSKPKPKPAMQIATISRNSLTVKSNARFLAYPLDKFPFKSKPLKELDIDAGCLANELIENEATRFKTIDAPKQIKVHCSLPEWDFRLRKMLNKMQRQIGEYNLFLADYMARLDILTDMINIVKLQFEFPFKALPDSSYWESMNRVMFGPQHPFLYLQYQVLNSDMFWEPGDKDQIEQAKNHRELYQALCAIRDKMVTSADKEESFLIFSKTYKNAGKQKADIAKVAERLYALLTAPKLRQELNRYMDSLSKQLQDEEIAKKVADEGFIPPGPDFEDEGNWCVIFNTIAECYGALASSDTFRQKLFDEQIAPSINAIIANDTNHTIEQEFKEVWDVDVIGQATKTVIPKDSYLVQQTTENIDPETPKDNLLSAILDTNTVETLELLWSKRGLVIPGPGAPCVLQVILSCYSAEVMTHVTKRVQTTSVAHLRFFNAVLRHWKVRELFSKEQFQQIFMAYTIVRSSDRSRNQRLVEQGRYILAKYSEEVATGQGKHSQDLFDSTLDSAASPYQGVAYAKLLYVFYNFTVNTQAALAIEEEAKKAQWSGHQTSLEMTRMMTELVSSRLQLVSDSLSIARSIEIALARMKTKGPVDVGTLRFGQIGQVLDFLSVGLTVFSLVNTSIDLYLTDPTDAEILAKGASLIADSAMLVGWATGIGVLTVVGTVITVVMVVYELKKLYRALNQTQVQKRLLAQWQLFKGDLDKETTQSYLEQVVKQSKISEDLEFDSTQELTAALARSPELTLKMLSPGTVEDIDEKLTDEFADLLPGFSYVELGNMSWRAVVPLHLLGYSEKLIEDLVKLDPSLEDFTGITTVSDIIQYYNQVREQELSHPDRNFDSQQSTHIYIGPGLEKKAAKGVNWGISANIEYGIDVISIAQLLETGLFTPPEPSEQAFFLGNAWNHPSFRIPKLYVESIHGEEQ